MKSYKLHWKMSGKAISNALRKEDKMKETDSIRKNYYLLIVGFSLGALYWIVDSLLDSLLTGNTFREGLFHPSLTMVVGRSFIAFIFIAFSVYVRYIITKHKLVKDRIRLQSRILETMEEGVFLVRASDGIIVYVNPGFERMFGYQAEEIVGKNVSVINAPAEKDPQDMAAEILKGLSENGEWKGEISNIKKDGTEFWCNANVSAFQHPEHGKVWIAEHTDITERKLAEEKLKDNEERFRSTFEIAAVGVAHVRTDGRFLRLNQKFCDIVGYTRDELLEKTFQDITYPDDLSSYLEQASQLLAGQIQSYSMEKRYIRKDGTNVWVDLTGSIVRGNSKINDYFIAIVEDITERKRLEKELRDVEQRLQTVVNNAPITIFSLDTHGVFTLSEGKGLEAVGLKPGENVGVSAYDLFAQLPVLEKTGKMTNGSDIIHRVLAGEMVAGITELAGRYFDNQFVPFRDNDSQVIGFIGVATDITDRRQSEEKLRESEELFRKVFEEGPIGMVLTSRDLKIFNANPAFRQMLGYTEEEMNTRTFLDVTYPEHRRTDRENGEKLWEGKIPNYRTEKRYITKNGDICWGSLSTSLIRGRDGKPLYALAMVENITERKLVEEALSKRKKDLKEAQRLAKIGSWDWDATTDTITWSEEYYHIYGFDPTLRPVGYEDHLKAYTPESSARLDAAVKRNIQTGQSYELDLELTRTEGPRRWITARSETKRNAQGQIIGLRGTVQDITERKRAEENMKNSLKEKEILLKEIHHRVKNNLQVISSLLYLQSKKLSDAKSLEVFNEGQNRIRSMVLIHEQLYKSGDLARINFDKYIHDLTHSLVLSYGSMPITFNIHVDGVYFGVDQAIPCGLILNELISNALKHAFTPGKQGQIEIDLRTDNSDYLTLTVKDNGVGFPKNLDFRNTTSLGLNIINKLVNQLKGTIELDTNAGTEFMIRFPNQNKI